MRKSLAVYLSLFVGAVLSNYDGCTQSCATKCSDELDACEARPVPDTFKWPSCRTEGMRCLALCDRQCRANIIGGIVASSAGTVDQVCLNQMGSSSTTLVNRVVGRTIVCDMNDDGGHWTVIQRRKIGDVNFYRGWTDYVWGFGNGQGDFWAGLEVLHQICKVKCQLKIVIGFKGKNYYAKYSSFQVQGQNQNYKMSVSGYSGDAGDSLTQKHSGMMFSTMDRDNDWLKSGFCAKEYQGAWWHSACYDSNLNGIWGGAGPQGLIWRSKTGPHDSATFSELKVRPVV